jgi:peptidoglycan/LPS O-acetylase OafA/YrhL
LTSLRFFAALMIVLLHARLYAQPSLGLFKWPWLAGMPETLVHGVSFFFVLSGFILTHVYMNRPPAGSGYWRFIALRFGRLWPVYTFALVLLMISALTPIAIVRHDSVAFDGTGWFDKWLVLDMNLPMLQSWSPWLVHQQSWNAVSWTVSTEFMFYFAFPFLVVGIVRTWGWKLAGAAAIVAAFLAIDHFWVHGSQESGVDILYANPLYRGFEFVLGMAAYVLWSRRIRRLELPPQAWTAIEAAALLLVIAWLYAPVWAILANVRWVDVAGSAPFFAVLIVVLASARGRAGQALSLAPLVFLGEISYSIYILHLLLMKVLWSHGVHNISAAIFFALLIAVCSATYFAIERPARDWVRRTVSTTRREDVPAPVPAAALSGD